MNGINHKPKVIARLFAIVLALVTLLSTAVYAIDGSPDIHENSSYNTNTYNEVNLSPVEYDEDGNEIAWVLSPESDSATPYATNLELLITKITVSKASSGFSWKVNVDCPSSIIFKPRVSLHVELQRSTGSSSGIYSTVAQKTIDEVNYLTNYVLTTSATTGYYRAVVTYTDLNSGRKQTSYTPNNLYNRSAKRWAYSYDDPVSGKELAPPRANWSYIPGTSHDGTYRNYYLTQYKSRYGIDLIAIQDPSDPFEIHHQRPLSYGGDSSFDNLIHLPKSLHQQVSGWFNGY